MGRLATFSRRAFLLGSAAVTGGVVFGYWRYRQPYDNPLEAHRGADVAVLTPYVRIDRSGVTLIAPRAEMGQGVHTTLAALLAEELDVTLGSVRVEHGPASSAYYNSAILEEAIPFAQTDTGWIAESSRAALQVPARLLGLQVTGGSSSVADAFVKMRSAGAAARHVLLDVAADRLEVDRSTLSTADGAVVSGDGQRLAYTALAADAASIEPPADPILKDPAHWKVLGRSQPRVDMTAKCTGTATYSIDVRRDGMRYATTMANPHRGAGIGRFDASTVSTMPGVERVIELSDAIAIVASNTWYAFRAAATLSVDWPIAEDLPRNSAAMYARVEAALSSGDSDSRLRDDGDVDAALSDTRLAVIDAEYRVPYLAHATLEPMNAVAHLDGHRMTLWVGTQSPTQVVKEAVALTGLAAADVTVNTTLMGGGFGRRAEMDFVRQAIEIAMAMPGVPVKLTWTRGEDMSQDFYRPMAVARLRGAVSQGRVEALDLAVASQAVIASQMGRVGYPVPGPDISIVQSAWDQPYAIEHYRITGYRVPPMLPVGSWRAVGASQNGFFHECAIDELAQAAGIDPLAMRLQLLDHGPSRRVLEAVARMSHWGSPLPPGHARGVAFVLSFGVPTAQVIEVADTDEGLRILEVFAAVDVGIALDPRNIEAQVQGGINFGLAAAVTGEISVAEGRVEQSNYHDYDCIRMHQAPRRISVRVLENGERIRGIGEPGVPPVAPALANAIFAATGRRIRVLPLRHQIRFAGLA